MIEIKNSDDLIAKRIKQAMNEKGYANQKAFCQSFSDYTFEESMLSDIFNGKRRTIDNLLRIAGKLDCSLDYLVGYTDINKREWNDIDRSTELISKETGLSAETIKKLIVNKHEEYWNYAIETIINSPNFIAICTEGKQG